MFDRIPKTSKIEYPKIPNTPISTDHYFKIMNEIFENIGQDTPLYEMANKLCNKFGIPSGPTSTLTRSNFDSEQEKELYNKAKEDDKTIGTVFLNIPGVYLGMGQNKLKEKAPIVTMDINKILDALEKGQEGLEVKFEEFLSALPEKDRNIIKGERELREQKSKQFNKNRLHEYGEVNQPLIYFRPNSNVSIFLRGYIHNEEWQKNFGTELIDIYAQNSSLISIEGFATFPIGKSLLSYWQSSNEGDYDVLMREIARKNPDILFGEVDGRNKSKVKIDSDIKFKLLDLPVEFYENYYDYLLKINPKLKESIESPEVLKTLLLLQSTSFPGTTARGFEINSKDVDTKFYSHPSLDNNFKASSHMTGLELGQVMYSDALSSIKLHLLAKLSSDRYLPVNSIADFQGAKHLSGKAFFMQYPQYALMVILTNIHELMAGDAKKLNKNKKTALVYSRDIFKNQKWKDVIKEILKLPIFSVEADPEKTVDTGSNQKTLIKKTPNFAKIYGLDLSKIAKELKKIFEHK